MNDLKPCPFCGGKPNFYRENYVNRFGKRIIKQYWMHDDTDCVLNDINQPFVLGAGDANGVLPLCANYCPNCGAKMDGGQCE